MKWHIPLCYGITFYLVNVVRSKLFINEDEYDHVYRLIGRQCSFAFIYQNQYQKSLVKWDGSSFYLPCTKTFKGRNGENVATDYTVCLNVLDYYISDCKVKVEYRYIDVGINDLKGSFSCNDKFPKKLCIDHQATLRIEADRNTSSYLRLEVTVKAGTNLSMTACMLIIAAIGALIITISIILVWKCRKSKKPDDRVLREGTDPATSIAGMPLINYPTEPVGRGMYNAQMQAQQWTPPTTRSVTPSAPPIDLSAPPPSYEECT